MTASLCISAAFVTKGCDQFRQGASERSSVLDCRANFLYERLMFFTKYYDALDSASDLSDLESTKLELLMQVGAIIRTVEEDEELRAAIDSQIPYLDERLEVAKSRLKSNNMTWTLGDGAASEVLK